MYKYATRILPIFAGIGFATWKSKSYGHRNCEIDSGIGVISMIPIINIIFGLPFIIGYELGEQHDKLLHYWNPKYYQKEIDEYRNEQHRLYLESQKDRQHASCKGNPQITLF